MSGSLPDAQDEMKARWSSKRPKRGRPPKRKKPLPKKPSLKTLKPVEFVSRQPRPWHEHRAALLASVTLALLDLRGEIDWEGIGGTPAELAATRQAFGRLIAELARNPRTARGSRAILNSQQEGESE